MFDIVQIIHAYPRNFPNGATLQPLYSITLSEPISRMQGRPFSSSGRLYVVSDNSSDTARAGIRVPGTRAAREQGALLQAQWPFAGDSEELEGIDIWDLDLIANRHPGVGGKIHVMPIDWVSAYDLYGKHERGNDPAHLQFAFWNWIARSLMRSPAVWLSAVPRSTRAVASQCCARPTIGEPPQFNQHHVSECSWRKP